MEKINSSRVNRFSKQIKHKKYFLMSGKTLKALTANTKLFVLVIVFAGGMLAGALILSRGGSSEIVDRLVYLADSYRKLRTEQSIAENFCNSLLGGVAFILISAFLGFSAIGNPITAVLPFFKGLGLGFFAGYMYSQFALKGLGYCVLIVFPAEIVANLALIMSCKESGILSRQLYEAGLAGKGALCAEDTKLFLTRQLILCGIAVLSSLIGAVLCRVFGSFFVFG